MPANARSSLKPETATTNRNTNGAGVGATVKNSMSELNSAQTEDEKIKALFSLQANQWKEQQEEMAKYVHPVNNITMTQCAAVLCEYITICC